MILPREERKYYNFSDKTIVLEKLVLFVAKISVTIFVLILIYIDKMTILNIFLYGYILLLPYSTTVLVTILLIIIGIPVIVIKNIIKLFKHKSNEDETS